MPPDLDFILKAASGGMEEVALGDLATQKTQSEQIKQLAALLVEEHTTANGELMQIAASKGIQVPNTTSITSQTVAASMSELNGRSSTWPTSYSSTARTWPRSPCSSTPRTTPWTPT